MDRKQQILQAAKRMMDEHGMQAVSVRSVAAAVGIGPSTLRYYFPTQQALFDALAQHFVDEISDTIAFDPKHPRQYLETALAQLCPMESNQRRQARQGLILLLQHADEFETPPVEAQKYIEQLQLKITHWLHTLEQHNVPLIAPASQLTLVTDAFVNGLSYGVVTGIYQPMQATQALRDFVASIVPDPTTGDGK